MIGALILGLVAGALARLVIFNGTRRDLLRAGSHVSRRSCLALSARRRVGSIFSRLSGSEDADVFRPRRAGAGPSSGSRSSCSSAWADPAPHRTPARLVDRSRNWHPSPGLCERRTEAGMREDFEPASKLQAVIVSTEIHG